MAGSKGRSGGSNRKAPAAHQLAGTWRRDRHGARAFVTDGVLARLQELRVMHGFHRDLHAHLRNQYSAVIKRQQDGEKIDLGKLLRELRQQAAITQQLAAAIDRTERDLPTSPDEDQDDGFNEFDTPLRRTRRELAALHVTAKP
jgi:hypothetical protein